MNHLDPIQRPKGQANKGKKTYRLQKLTGVRVNFRSFDGLRAVHFENVAGADAIARHIAVGSEAWTRLCFPPFSHSGEYVPFLEPSHFANSTCLGSSISISYPEDLLTLNGSATQHRFPGVPAHTQLHGHP